MEESSLSEPVYRFQIGDNICIVKSRCGSDIFISGNITSRQQRTSSNERNSYFIRTHNDSREEARESQIVPFTDVSIKTKDDNNQSDYNELLRDISDILFRVCTRRLAELGESALGTDLSDSEKADLTDCTQIVSMISSSNAGELPDCGTIAIKNVGHQEPIHNNTPRDLSVTVENEETDNINAYDPHL